MRLKLFTNATSNNEYMTLYLGPKCPFRIESFPALAYWICE